ncbi:MAG: transposase [Candidatus Peregrinibacteria bacterium]
MLNLHLKGASIRTLAARIGRGLDATYARLVKELGALPHNNDVTAWYCNWKRFGGSLVVDGKYVAVKGYAEKIPFIYGIDYVTHDIPVCLLAPSENFEALVQFFTKLKNMNYPLRSVTCDENDAIRMAAQYVFPGCIVQICHVHFLENIRRTLKVRSEETYRRFLADLEEHIFAVPLLGRERLEARIRWRSPRHYDDPVKIATMNHIFESSEKLTAYVRAKTVFHIDCPRTTNLIESMNKQLNGRLKTIQGFESFQTAERWLSAWILRKRFTPFTDCRGKFKGLNGTPSIENTRRGGLKIPDFFHLQRKAPETER